MKVVKNTTPVTDAISQIAMAGNVIPHSWYSTIRLGYGNKGQTKPDLYAINFLADVVYWYRNQQTRDEATGELVAIRKKFRSDKLQRSYADIGGFFGLSADVGKEIVERLRKMGLVRTEVRKKVVEGDRVFFNVLFIEPVPEAIMAITHDAEVLETQARKVAPEGTPAPAGTGNPEGAPAPAGSGTPAPAPGGAPAPHIYQRLQVPEISSTKDHPPIAPPQAAPDVQAGQGGGLVDVAAMEFPASLPEVEHGTARKILCGLEGGDAQLLLDTLAAKLHAGEKVNNRMGMLRWMVGQLGKGELDTSAGQAWRARQQAAKLEAAGATPQNLNALADDIRALQQLQKTHTDGSPGWQAFAGQIEGKKRAWHTMRDLLVAAGASHG